MIGATGLALVAGAICLALAAWCAVDSNKKNKILERLFALFAIVFFMLSYDSWQQDINTQDANRQARSQLAQDHPGIKIRGLSSQHLTVSYALNGKYCEGSLLYFQGRYLLGDDAVCSAIKPG